MKAEEARARRKDKIPHKAAGLTVLDNDGNMSFCHDVSTLEAVEGPQSEISLCFAREARGM